MPRHDKEGITMPRKVTAMADLTAIGCQVETTATAAGKVRWLGRDLVIRPDAMWVRVRRLRPGPCWREGRAESARLPER